MRKIVFYGAISIDGYLADEHHDLTWLTTTPAGEGTTYDAFEKTFDTTVMGRKTYEVTHQLLEGAPFYPDKTNFVFSHRLADDLPDAHVPQEPLIPFLKKLREQEGQAIWIVGGGKLLRPILEADLIDEWQIQIAPVFLGKGIRLFESGDYHQRLQLVETSRFGEFCELRYRKISSEPEKNNN